jgi:hypothetical protein
MFALQIERQRREEEVELALAEEIAPWLLNPKTSNLLKFQSIVISLALQFELILVPLVLLDPSILLLYADYILVLDVIWCINIVVKLQTVKPEKPSDNPL